MNVGQRIRELRRLRKMSENKLAEALGLSQAQVSRYETGENEVPLSVLERICAVLEVTLADFFAPTGHGNLVVPNHLQPLLEAARDLSPEQVELLLPIIREFKRRKG